MSQASEQTPLLSNRNDSDARDTSESTNGVTINGNGNGHVSASKPTAGDVEAGEADVLPTVRLATIVPALAIGIFLAAMDGTIVVSAYGAIGSDLNELQKTSWVATSYLLSTTAFQPLYGKLSDIFGRKSCIIVAYILFSIGSAWCGLARNMNELIAARAFAGIGGGGMTTVVSIIMSDIVPLHRRGTWQGIINIVFATGAAIGAPLGGFLADSIGWRWAFLMQTPAALVAAAAVGIFLKLHRTSDENWKQKLRRVDFLGAITLVIAIGSLLVGLDRGGNVSWLDTTVLITLPLSLVFFLAFGFVEGRIATDPFAPLRIIGDKALLAAFMCNFFAFASFYSVLFYVPLYFQAVASLSASRSGLRLVPAIAGSVTGSLTSGITMQKTGKYRKLTIFAYSLILIGVIPIVLFTGLVARNFVGIELGLVIEGFGNGIGVTTTLISLIAKAGPADQAVATAGSYLFRSLGSVLGVSVCSTILQAVLRARLREELKNDANVDEIVRQARGSLTFLKTLKPEVRSIVIHCYEIAVRYPFILSAVLALGAVISSLFVVEVPLRKPEVAKDNDEDQETEDGQ